LIFVNIIITHDITVISIKNVNGKGYGLYLTKLAGIKNKYAEKSLASPGGQSPKNQHAIPTKSPIKKFIV